MAHDIKHLAIIMDGNARWAKSRNLTVAEGHTMGAHIAMELVPGIAELGISCLTLYAFSSENWHRPKKEVSLLMQILSYYVENKVHILHENQIKLKVIGNLDKISAKLRKKSDEAIRLTENNDKMTLYLAVSYGSREEITRACQKIIDSGRKNITEADFPDFLYDPDMPDVDLFIRPSGVRRVSNFLLWQSAYAELYFIDKYWPDLTLDDIRGAIDDYSKRKRFFGRR